MDTIKSSVTPAQRKRVVDIAITKSKIGFSVAASKLATPTPHSAKSQT